MGNMFPTNNHVQLSGGLVDVPKGVGTSGLRFGNLGPDEATCRATLQPASGGRGGGDKGGGGEIGGGGGMGG